MAKKLEERAEDRAKVPSGLQQMESEVEDYCVWHAEFDPESPTRWRISDALSELPDYDLALR